MKLVLKRSLVLVVLLAATSLVAQTETGKFRLHKFEQAIGEESYTITRTGETLDLSTDFQFTDRGQTVPLKASMKAGTDYTPTSFEIKGNTSRSSTIDSTVTMSGGNAQIREGKQTRAASAPKQYFTIAGYAPVSIQMALLRYWRQHGLPRNWRPSLRAKCRLRIAERKRSP